MTRGAKTAKVDINELIRDAQYEDMGSGKTKKEWHDEAREAGAKSFHDVSYSTPFKNPKTYTNNKQILTELNTYIRSEFKCRSIRSITPEMVGSFLQHKIDSGIGAGTFFKTISPAVNNLEAMLNRVGVGANFQDVLKESKILAREKCPPPDQSSRAYGADAERIIGAMKDERAAFCAHLQLEYGLRSNESFRIHLIAGKENVIEIHQKGGYRTEKAISPEDYQKLVAMGGGRQNFTICNYQRLQHCFDAATHAVGVKSHGLHGLRAEYACRNMDRLQGQGMSETAAKVQVSESMGHHRANIIDTYLRGR